MFDQTRQFASNPISPICCSPTADVGYARLAIGITAIMITTIIITIQGIIIIG